MSEAQRLAATPEASLSSFLISGIETRNDGTRHFALRGLHPSGFAANGAINTLTPGPVFLVDGTRAGLSCKDHRTGVISQPCPALITQYEATAQGMINTLEIADIDQDGNRDLILGPSGWNEHHTELLSRFGNVSPVLTLLLGNQPDPAQSRYLDVSPQVQYLAASGLSSNHLDPVLGVDRQVQMVMGTNAADFDGDGDLDLLVVDFNKVVYYDNQGRDCWLRARQDGRVRCLVERTSIAFPGGSHGYDGVYGPKNYGATVGDFNHDRRLDFFLRAAGEDLLYEQQ
jgi:hypothetical protein